MTPHTVCIGLLISWLTKLCNSVKEESWLKCDEGYAILNRAPFCFSANYSNLHKPSMPDGRPLEIHTEISVLEIADIDDIQRTMTVNMYLTLEWMENRLVLTENSAVWNKTDTPEYELDLAYLSDFWIPDLEIHRISKFRRPQAIKEIGGLLVTSDQTIIFTVNTYITIECPFEYQNYPMDIQLCKLQIGSFFHERNDVMFTGSWTFDGKYQRITPYEIVMRELSEEDMISYYRQGTEDEEMYSVYGFEVQFTRTFQPFLLRSYLPSAVFVIVSWVSFTVDPAVVPGRMALLVTLLLMLINVSNTISETIPIAQELTAIEEWIFTCIAFVFMALLEYSLLLLYSRTKIVDSFCKVSVVGKEKITKLTRMTWKPEDKNFVNKTAWEDSQTEEDPKDFKRYCGYAGYKIVDTVALVIFSVAFLIFNVSYWRAYGTF